MPRKRAPTPEEKQAAARLRAIWEKKKGELGLTQEDAAEALGITQGAVSHYLNGRTALGKVATLRFAALLNVDPSDIQDVDDLRVPRTPIKDLPPKHQAVLELLQWIDDEELDELIRALEKAKRDKVAVFNFVREKGGFGT